jgi:hypothetical protein
MNKTVRVVAAAAAVLMLAGPLRAQGVFQTSITIALPPVLPPLVVVQPGIQVVEDLDDEVFYSRGWYWVRRDDFWYRARDCRGRWIFVEPRFVPYALRRTPPGHYRHFRKAEWKAAKEAEKGRWREFKRGEKERRKEEHEEKHHGHDRQDD